MTDRLCTPSVNYQHIEYTFRKGLYHVLIKKNEAETKTCKKLHINFDMQTFKDWNQFIDNTKSDPKIRREAYFLAQLGRLSGKEITEFTIQDAIEASKKLNHKTRSPKTLYNKYFGENEKSYPFNKSLNTELVLYENAVTSYDSTQFPKNFIQRKHTFQNLTLLNIKYFINYLLNMGAGIEPAHINSLLPFLKKYLIQYTKHLINKYKTNTPQLRTRCFISMMRYFYQVPEEELAPIENEYRSLINRQRPILGKRGQNIMYNKITLEMLLPLLKLPRVQDRLLYNLLIRMGWRSRNIRECKLGEHIYFEDGWKYDFPPDMQKAPIKVRDTFINVRGSFPKQLSDLITEYLIEYPKENGEYLLDRGRVNGTQLIITSDNLYAYSKKLMKRTLGFFTSPHSFRSIIANEYTKKTGNFPVAEIWLWHKLNLSSSMYNYVLPDFDMATARINKFIDWMIKKNRG